MSDKKTKNNQEAPRKSGKKVLLWVVIGVLILVLLVRPNGLFGSSSRERS